MRFNKTAIKSIAATLVLGQLNMALQPLYAAVSQDKGASNPMVRSQIERLQALQRSIDEGKARKAQENLSPADQASQRLARVEELVRDIAYHGEHPEAPAGTNAKDQVRAIGPNLKARIKPLTAEQKVQRHDRRQQLIAELKGLLGQQTQDQGAVRAEFAQTRQTLLDRKLPAEILARHDEAVAKFEQRVAQFNQSAGKAQQGDEQALAELQSFFDQNPTKRKAAPVDPAKLPWRTPEPTKRLPAETQTAWFQNLYANKGTRLAQVGNSLEGLEFVTPPEPGVAPTAADLAETPETQRTAAIKAKALELGNNPVNIQNWVRNNVEWVPTWGAIQSAQDTLDKKRGNAIDIASLEIALLRAAKIPARYQFGTIELPAEQVMNWVGGVTKPEAAQQLLGQGGIANRGLIEGGRISKIRMEHAWVQAYVNWLPSRGAKQGSATQHPSPQAPRNAWVPLDPSFKQHNYTAGLDLRAHVPLDIQALLNAAKQGGLVNDADGSAQSMNRQAMRAMLDDYQARLKTYVDQQGPNVSIGDIVGKKINPTVVNSLLAGSLPYTVVQSGTAESAVPPGLQHKFMYKLYASAQDQTLEEPLLAYTEKVSQLVGKRFTLNYVPASQADADAIASYMPKAHADGSPVQPKEFPTSLPGYLIRLKPQLMLDGHVVASGSQGLPMGTTLEAEGGYTSLAYPGGWDITPDGSNVVGNSTAIGISAHGINVAQMNRLKARMDLIRQQLQAQNLSNMAELSSGLLVTPIWTWFLEVESAARDASKLTGMVHNGGLSYGLFHNVAHPSYSWGVIKSVRFTGANLDIGHVRHLAWSRANILQEWINHNNGLGQYMSALEHIVPERTFNPRSECKVIGAVNANPLLPTCPQGVSAVKALGLAAQRGQKIFAITPAVYQANPDIVSGHLSAHSVETRNAVQSYLDAGMAVTIHQAPISQDGWKGAGYVYTDPSSGSGGYIIEGGSNGGAMEYLKDNSTNIGFGLFAAGLIAGLLPAWVGLAIGIAAFLVSITVMYMVYMEAILSAQCERAIPCIQAVAMVSTIMAVIGLLALAGSGMGALLASVAGLIFADDMFNGIVGTCNTVACRSTPPEPEF